MRHKRLVFSRIQHFSISAAGMSRSQKGSSSRETELLPERYPRLRIVAILPSIVSAVVYFATSALSKRSPRAQGAYPVTRSCSKELDHARRAAHFVAPGTDMVYNLPLATN